MPIPSFEDRYMQYTASGYAATNEEPELFRRLLNGKRFKRVATIASAGEIPMLVLLSLAKEVVAVDHSYRSLCVCFIKAIMLDLLGPKEMKRFLIEESYEKFCELLKERILPLMPLELASKVILPTASRGLATIAKFEYNEIRREWQWVNPSRMKYIRDNMHRIKYVHGDITDLPSEEKFDLLYISNALDHGSRTELTSKLKGNRLDHWAKLIKPGGWLMAASATYKVGLDRPDFKKVKEIAGIRTTWVHELFRQETPKPVEVTA